MYLIYVSLYFYLYFYLSLYIYVYSALSRGKDGNSSADENVSADDDASGSNSALLSPLSPVTGQSIPIKTLTQ